MMPRFTLKQLLTVVAFASIACAALARPGYWWHATVVTAISAAAIGMLLAAILGSPQQRAFSIGWLVLAVGYLACVLGPWTGQHLGPQLLSSKGLVKLESSWHKDRPSPPALEAVVAGGDGVWIDGWPHIIRQPLNSGVISWNLAAAPAAPSSPQAGISSSHSLFQATGHWLLAVVLGHIGGSLAAAQARRRHAAV